MRTATLEQVRRLVDQLSLPDQARLLEYLTPRVVRTVVSGQQAEAVGKAALPEAWAELFRIGDAIAALDTPQTETLTSAVTSARR
ncbi:MAG: hypothetical protein L0332_26135 [Chloroflexi bacterium]|nr:hypothetical protein [Chloroflexota bacterium]MCI0579994.1 hypothetical protein [Chloroflexota bacterium]MCI0646419.1 hypothetical protein [Chloroflexota bacterium]MCI0730179.1 hypothetical protein [Chloroflexota bacterium]